MRYRNVAEALAEPGTELRLFCKPEIDGMRRLGVALAGADSVDAERAQARRSAAAIGIDY